MRSRFYFAGRFYPILMYHKVGAEHGGHADSFLNVRARDFQRQMQLMATLGYRTRPFAEIVDALTRGRSLPRRTFAVTFDDGYSCVGVHAAPALEVHGFVATVFVVSGAAGGTNLWDRSTGWPELPLMGWEELRRLHALGWEIAGHTASHPRLACLEDAVAQAEILEGKKAVEAQLGCALKTFCYPFGSFNPRTPALVRAAGFEGACTTRSGLAQPGMDPFLLPRVKVAYRDRVSGLLYRLFVRPLL
ncbi:MAG: polysaccharide deacetylase family protein [Chloroherpetonaceae bacterium]|nr:polysaccharide deacetylase family protein [Chloroherpetonaceae bacterium]